MSDGVSLRCGCRVFFVFFLSFMPFKATKFCSRQPFLITSFLLFLISLPTTCHFNSSAKLRFPHPSLSLCVAFSSWQEIDCYTNAWTLINTKLNKPEAKLKPILFFWQKSRGKLKSQRYSSHPARWVLVWRGIKGCYMRLSVWRGRPAPILWNPCARAQSLSHDYMHNSCFPLSLLFMGLIFH